MFRCKSIVPSSSGGSSPESETTTEPPQLTTSTLTSLNETIKYLSPRNLLNTPIAASFMRALQGNRILPNSTEPPSYNVTPLSGPNTGIRDGYDTDSLKDANAPSQGSRYFSRDVVSRASRQFSTTSTIYTNGTIINPDMRSVFLCISSVIQAQIVSDYNLSHEEKNRYPELDIIPDIPPDLGGPVTSMTEEHMRSEANNDEHLYEMISNGTAPTVDNIFRFMANIYTKLPNNPEYNIIALIYINRMASKASLPLTMSNWRAVWFISVILAYKVFDDQAMNLSKIASILPIFDRKVLCKLEMCALTLLDYSTVVIHSLYFNYYCELRQMFSEINNGTVNHLIPQLTLVRAKQIEAKLLRSEPAMSKHKDRIKQKIEKQKGLSKTLEDDIIKNTPYIIPACP